MIDILFTDTHFGWKNNSMTWLNTQLDFIYKQFVPKIKELKKKDYVRVIHMGDVFDSRSTISTYVATKVIEAFKEIRNNCDEFIIICGNHDFYSPNSDEINSVSLFMSNLDIKIVDKETLIIDDHAFIPWYKWQNSEFDSISKDIKYVFTHADIIMGQIDYKLIDKKIFSGHIHIPKLYKNLYNIGSCYCLNFADANSTRGFYIFENDNLEYVENKYSIKFHRIKGKDILNILDTSIEDYIELHIPQICFMNQEYIDAIKEYSEKYKHLWVIPIVEEYDTINESIDFDKYDITSMISKLIPEDLLQLYNQVKIKIEN